MREKIRAALLGSPGNSLTWYPSLRRLRHIPPGGVVRFSGLFCSGEWPIRPVRFWVLGQRIETPQPIVQPQRRAG